MRTVPDARARFSIASNGRYWQLVLTRGTGRRVRRNLGRKSVMSYEAAQAIVAELETRWIVDEPVLWRLMWEVRLTFGPPGPHRKSDFRPAPWFAGVTRGALSRDRVRKAGEDGRVTRVRRGSHWHYHVGAVALEFPEFAAQLGAATGKTRK